MYTCIYICTYVYMYICIHIYIIIYIYTVHIMYKHIHEKYSLIAAKFPQLISVPDPERWILSGSIQQWFQFSTVDF